MSSEWERIGTTALNHTKNINNTVLTWWVDDQLSAFFLVSLQIMGGTSGLWKLGKTGTNHKVTLQIILFHQFDWMSCIFSFTFYFQNAWYFNVTWYNNKSSFYSLHYFPLDLFIFFLCTPLCQYDKKYIHILCICGLLSWFNLWLYPMNNPMECTKNVFFFFFKNPHVSFVICLHTDDLKCNCNKI